MTGAVRRVHAVATANGPGVARFGPHVGGTGKVRVAVLVESRVSVATAGATEIAVRAADPTSVVRMTDAAVAVPPSGVRATAEGVDGASIAMMIGPAAAGGTESARSGNLGRGTRRSPKVSTPEALTAVSVRSCAP